MQYIVMDLEFNQPFDFEDGSEFAPNPDCPFEIIQVGMVLLDSELNIRDTLELNVLPTLYRRLHPFVAKITGLTRRDLAGWPQFPKALESIKGFLEGSGEDCVLAVWGGSDVKLLYKNIRFHKLDAAGIPERFVDVQQLANKHFGMPGGASVGLKNAVGRLGIEPGRAFHNALGDALYTAQIFQLVCGNQKELDIRNILEPSKKQHTHPKNFDPTNVDYAALYQEAEKLLGGRLTANQKKIVRRLYNMGAQHLFGPG